MLHTVFNEELPNKTHARLRWFLAGATFFTIVHVLAEAA